ncbi:MAG: hypothetical protein LBE95_00900 [Holosporaceae bacterium]|nr:hypothetical protein [Holosporaceae bacterium]
MYRALIFLLCIGCSARPLYQSGDLSDAQNIDVDIIAERDGQRLRGMILDSLRDVAVTSGKYRLTIGLSYTEKPFAYTTDGNAKRVQICYVADVILRDEKRIIIFRQPVSVYSNADISTDTGSVLLSLYGRNNIALLKELSVRIIENLKVFLSHES